MNERIKELKQQAGIQDNPDQEGLDLFAELIIEQCAQACINMGNEYEIKSAGQYQAELFAFAIKKHFGVEE